MSNFMAQIKVKETGREYLATFLDNGNGYDIYAVGKGGKELKFSDDEVEILDYK